MSLTELLFIGLAVFRLTRLFMYDKIMEFLRAPFFNVLTETDEDGKKETYLVPKDAGIRKFIGELLNCYWCTGMWMTFFLIACYWFIPAFGKPLIIIFAVAGLAAIIETIISFLAGHID